MKPEVQDSECVHSIRCVISLVLYSSYLSFIASSLAELASVAAEIIKYVHAAHHLSETVLQSNTTALENECGLSNAGVSVLQDGAALLHNVTHFVNNAWIDTRHLLECSTFNPMYTTFVYDVSSHLSGQVAREVCPCCSQKYNDLHYSRSTQAICDEGVNGLTWLFSTAFALAFFAMLMITFRAGLYPVKRP